MPQKPPLSLTVTWALPHHPKDPSAPDTPFWRCLQDFLDGDDAVRANIFKLIPRCALGGSGWWVRVVSCPGSDLGMGCNQGQHHLMCRGGKGIPIGNQVMPR